MTTGYASLKVELATGQDPLTSGTLTWTDYSTSLVSATINRGRDNQWDVHSPGTASFTFSTQKSNTFRADTALLAPNTPVRISANDSTATQRFLFTGFIQPQPGPTFDFHDAVGTTTIQCHDLLGIWARKFLTTPPLASAMVNFTPGEFHHTFTDLDSAYGLQPVWGGSDGVQGKTIVQVPYAWSQDVSSLVQSWAQCEGGAIYILGDGTVAFDSRTAISARSRMNTSQVTFDDTKVSGTSYARDFTVWQPTIYSSTSVTMQDGTVYTYTDSTASAAYADSALPTIDGSFLPSSSEAISLVERLVRTSNTLVSCPKTIRLFPTRSDQLDAAVKRELRDFCTFKNAAAHITGAKVHVERIQHTIDAPSKSWTCDLSFSSRDQLLNAYDPTVWFLLDDATKGKSDGTRKTVW